MAKYPKVPWGSQNPFEKKLMRTEQEMREMREGSFDLRGPRGGCGDPRCPMCYGPNGEYTGGDMNPNERKDDVTSNRDAYARMRDMMMNDPRLFIQGGFGGVPTPSVDAQLRKLREPVADHILETPHDLEWESVVGNEAARTALREAIEDPIKHKELYAHYGMRPLKGVLLWGPPGCGKTMFGKVAASVIAKLHGKKAELLAINGAALQSPWVGVTEKKITDIFAYAREYNKVHGHPLTIFIDEADAILPPRNNSPIWSKANVSTFLAEMDGLEASGAFVILATNMPEMIDEALLRDGRCDRKIKVVRPGYNEGREIMQNELLRAPVWEEDLDRCGGHGLVAQAAMDYFVLPDHHVTEMTHAQTGEQINLTLAHIMSGAMMVGLVARAKGIAFRRDLAAGTRTGISVADLQEAINETLRENQGLNHDYALNELAEQYAMRQNLKGLN